MNNATPQLIKCESSLAIGTSSTGSTTTTRSKTPVP